MIDGTVQWDVWVAESMVWEVGTLLVSTILTVLVLLVEHWYPWERRLTRVQAYVYGVAALLAGFWFWRLLSQDWWTPLGMTLIAIVGGVGVIWAYRRDETVVTLRKARKAEKGDDELEAIEG